MGKHICQCYLRLGFDLHNITQLHPRKTKKTIKKWAKDLDTSLRRTHRGPETYEKMLSIASH